jgi:hypothetical protein
VLVQEESEALNAVRERVTHAMGGQQQNSYAGHATQDGPDEGIGNDPTEIIL